MIAQAWLILAAVVGVLAWWLEMRDRAQDWPHQRMDWSAAELKLSFRAQWLGWDRRWQGERRAREWARFAAYRTGVDYGQRMVDTSGRGA